MRIASFSRYDCAVTVVAFLTHPLGERDAEHGMRRGDNLSNAMAWFRYLKEITPWAICHPSMSYIAAVDEVFFRRTMLTDVIEIMCRCDLVVAVGSHMSPHMRIEIQHAENRIRARIPVLNLLDLGAWPPSPSDEQRANTVRLGILERAEAFGL